MSYVKIWLHCVWGTKNRLPVITKDIRQDVLDHILVNAKDKSIFIDTLNGYSEHIHCLLSLNPDMPLSGVIQLIKGESSFWINKNNITKGRFGWAVEYFAVSVSESHVRKVREYIKNQEDHHRKKTWEEEYNEFMNDYEFSRFRG